MYLKKCELLGLSCLLAAGVASGASVVSESFEGAETGAAATKLTSATWTGYGTVEANDNSAFASQAGRPIVGAAKAKVLRVDGYVTCAPKTALADGAAVQVDLMVQAVLPDEALAIPSGETDDIQIAVGTDTDKNLKVYCKDKSGTASWCTLKAVTADQWYRVSFIFDYTAKRCQVRVDGEPCMTAAGYLTATDTTDAAGAWYALNYTTNTKLSSIKVVGSTALDEVVIKAGTDEALAVPADAKDASGVALAWYDANGIAWAPDAKYDASDLTVAQKYERGLSPFDGEKLLLKTMTMTAKGATFAIPKLNPPEGKAAKLVYNTKPDFTGEGGEVAITANTDTVTIDTLPDGNVYYYRLEVK